MMPLSEEPHSALSHWQQLTTQLSHDSCGDTVTTRRPLKNPVHSNTQLAPEEIILPQRDSSIGDLLKIRKKIMRKEHLQTLDTTVMNRMFSSTPQGTG